MNLLKGLLIVSCTLLIWSCSNESGIASIENNSENKTGMIYANDFTELKTLVTNTDYTPSMDELGDSIHIIRRNYSNQLEHFAYNKPDGALTTKPTFGSNACSDPSICVNLNDNYLQCLVSESGNAGLAFYYRHPAYGWLKAGNFWYNITGSPAMICNSQTHDLEFVVIQNGQVHRCRRINGNWLAENQILSLNSGHTLTGDPAFSESSEGRVIAFTTKYDGQYYLNIWKSGKTGDFWGTYCSPEMQVYPKFALVYSRDSYEDVADIVYRKISGYGLYCSEIKDGSIEGQNQQQLSGNWIYNIGGFGSKTGNCDVFLTYRNRSTATNKLSSVPMSLRVGVIR